MAINKPPGWVANRARTVTGPTIQDWAQTWMSEKGFVTTAQRSTQTTQAPQTTQATQTTQTTQTESSWEKLVPKDFDDTYGQPQETFSARSGLAHRLDKDTSGVMLIALNPGSLVHLLAQFKKRTITKTYQALCHGRFQAKEGIIKAPLGRSSTFKRKAMQVAADGRWAETAYRVIGVYSDLDFDTLPKQVKTAVSKRPGLYSGFSLVECQPKTGRMHQLRVHLQYQGNPIVGDKQYLGKKRARLDKLWCPRHFLHAAKLRLTHPCTEHELEITAPLSPDLKRVLHSLVVME